MRKKRALSLALAAMLTATMIPKAHAANDPTVTLSSGSVDPGESVTLTVDIKDNPGIAGYMLYVYYDTSVFEADPKTDVSAAGEFADSGMFMANTIDALRKAGRYDGLSGKDGLLGLWVNGSGQNTSGDGDMMKISLQAKDNVDPGSYSIGLGYSKKNTCSEDAKLVPLNAKGGTVTVLDEKGNAPDEKPQIPQSPQFDDIEGNWAKDYIMQAAELGLVEGDGKSFMPDKTLSRAEFVTILWRNAGCPAPKKASSFTDITDKWYEDAVAWSEENGIVKGVGNNMFGSRMRVTREQIVTILHRMEGTPSDGAMYHSIYDDLFTDSGKLHDWSKDAVYWAVYKNIFCGQNSVDIGESLAPRTAATRSEAAVMLVRYLEKR